MQTVIKPQECAVFAEGYDQTAQGLHTRTVANRLDKPGFNTAASRIAPI